MVNEGFWDLSPQERGAAYDQAEDRHGGSFHDLTPEERGTACERAGERFGGE